jgi:hypothetical protein
MTPDINVLATIIIVIFAMIVVGGTVIINRVRARHLDENKLATAESLELQPFED